MRTAVVYYSETGNTAKVAGAIAAALGDEAGGSDAGGSDVILSSLQDAPALDGFDLVFVGMPVLRFGAPDAVRRYLAEQCAGRRVALFVTHTAPDELDQLQAWLFVCKEAAGAAQLVGFFHCQGALAEPVRQHMLSSGVPLLAEFAEHAGVADGQPDEAALARAAAFARETAERVRGDLAAAVAAV
jgi:hypothetical protein